MLIYKRMFSIMFIFSPTVMGEPVMKFRWNPIEHCLENLKWLDTPESRRVETIKWAPTGQFLRSIGNTFDKLGSVSTLIRHSMDPGRRADDEFKNNDDTKSITCSLDMSTLKNSRYLMCDVHVVILNVKYSVAVATNQNYITAHLHINMTDTTLIDTKFTPKKVYFKILPAVPQSSTLCYVHHVNKQSWVSRDENGPYIRVLNEEMKNIENDYVANGFITMQIDIYMKDPGYFIPGAAAPPVIKNKIYSEYHHNMS